MNSKNAPDGVRESPIAVGPSPFSHWPQKLLRLVLLILGLAIIAVLGFYARRMMIASLDYHSFWHYTVRFVGILMAVFTVILVAQSFSVRNPVESLGAPPALEVPFKFSNLIKRSVDISLSVVILTLLFPLLGLVAVLVFVLEGHPVFYVSKRYISMDQCVSVVKFRTMVKDSCLNGKRESVC